jgi:hypothetical protein
MPRFLLQRRKASPFRSTFIMILFCRVVDLGGKREGAAIDFFGAQEANVLRGKTWRGGLRRCPPPLDQCQREQKYDER